jgi:hypothetical protein
MGRINCKDHVLIKRQWVGKKKNATGEMFKDEKNEVIVKSDFRLLLEVVSIFKVVKFKAT